MSTSPVSGTIIAAGSANGVVLPITNPDTEAQVVVSGTYASLVLFIDGSRDGVVYVPLLAVRMSDLATQVCDPTGFAVTDNASRGWRIPAVEGLISLRVWAYSLGSGTVNVQIASGSFFATSPVTSSVGAGLTTTQVLFQLEQIRLALYWLKEPSGSHEPSLSGGGLLSFLGNPGQGI